MGCTNVFGSPKKFKYFSSFLREETLSLLFFKKEREKKNEPNKKENLKNILMDGLHKSFGSMFWSKLF